jgi:hypothetical protein
MVKISILVVLAGCVLFAATAAAEQKALPRRIELSLLVLDDEFQSSFEDGAMLTWPGRGAFVAMEMDCGPTERDPCRPRGPVAVLTTSEGMKRFIAGLPPGTSVDWNVSCLGPFPRQHPLSATGAQSDIEKFAAQHEVRFVVHKAG